MLTTFTRGVFLLLPSLLGNTASAEFVNGKPDFFEPDVPAPLAYYYLDDGAGYDLKESVSGDPAAGSVIFVEEHQVNSTHTEPNWIDDEFFGKTIGCGQISNKENPAEGAIQKDTLSLKDVDYGSNGSWAWSVWFRHEKDVNFPDYQREQFFGHGDPTQPTPSANQVHVQYEKSGNIRTIVSDSTDADTVSTAKTRDTLGVVTDNGNWHQLVLTTRKDGNKGNNLYIDGILQSSSPQGFGNRAFTNSEVWVAAGGEPMDPIGPIRLCGREQAQGMNENRYFRGQVAHFSVWDSALSQFEVLALYFSYSARFGLERQPDAVDTPQEESTTPARECPKAEPCDICEGKPIANPLTVINYVGFPPESCGNAGFEIANTLACNYGVTPEEACKVAIPIVKETCCVGDGSQAPPASDTPEPPAPIDDNEPEYEYEIDTSPVVASGGISNGALVIIVVGSIVVVAGLVFLVFKTSKSTTTEYDTNSPAIKAAIADHLNMEREYSQQESDTDKASSAMEDAAAV